MHDYINVLRCSAGEGHQEVQEGTEEGWSIRPHTHSHTYALTRSGTPKAARGTTSFMFFSIENRPTVKDENPEMTFGDLGKELGRLWKELDKKSKVH